MLASSSGGASPTIRASPRGVGGRKVAGLQEREQFEQVEPRQFGIAQPLPDQRRVEHDHRRVGRAPDRLAAPDRTAPSASAIHTPAWLAWRAG